MYIIPKFKKQRAFLKCFNMIKKKNNNLYCLNGETVYP